MLKRNHILLALLLAIFLAGSVSAERFIEYTARNGIVHPDGLETFVTPITGYESVTYICANAECSNISGTLNRQPDRTTTESMVINYPTTLQSRYGYGAFFYKDGHIPWEQGGITFAGTKAGETSTNPMTGNTIYLTKAEICRAQVDTFSVTNAEKPYLPVIVNVSAELDATTHAALSHAGPIEYVPGFLSDKYYSLETLIQLVIRDSNGDVVFDDFVTTLIEYSKEKRLGFIWTPDKADRYTATVSSFVTDDKCLESQEMQARKDFSVFEDINAGTCYTLLNNLSAAPLFAREGDQVTVQMQKLSNSVSGRDVYSPLPTNIELTVYDEQFRPIYTETKTAPATSRFD